VNNRDVLLALPAALMMINCSSGPAAPSCTDQSGRGETALNAVKVSCKAAGSRLQCQAIASIEGLYVYCPRTEDVTASAVWAAGDSAIARLVAPGQFEAAGVGDTTVHAAWQNLDSNAFGLTPVSVFPGTPPLPTHEIAGTVTDASRGPGIAIAGATVEILDGIVAGRTATTGVPPPLLPGYLGPFDINGYRLLGVPPGTYHVRATKGGYVSQDAVATVTETGGPRISFALAPR
jgi:hypothetical protein